jgi:iron complex outermembrane receptor protein
MNTLVLVDGRRITEIDLSGTDWTQIPVHRIERIEVLRGGTGSVLYGDNAQAGVVNIITRQGKDRPSVSLEAEGGSYDFNRQRLSTGGAKDRLSYWLDAAHTGTHGYRRNSHYQAQDLSGKLTCDLNETAVARFSGSFHTAQFGLPGALSETNLATLGRRGSAFRDDHVNDRDYSLSLGGKTNVFEDTVFDADLSFRRKDVDNLFLSSCAGFNPIYRNRLDTVGFTPKFVFSADISGRENKLIAGMDLYRSDYSSDNYSDGDILQNFTDITKTSHGYYVQDELAVMPKLSVMAGWRYEQAQYDFDYHDQTGFNADIEQTMEPDQRAFNSGLVYRYADGASAFATLGRSFRFPAADEYFSVWSTPPVNTRLKPQKGKNYEVGIKQSLGSGVRVELTLYRMDLRDELYYDPLTYTNSNYDTTRHQGIETGMRTRVSERLSLSGSYTYTDARFKTGTYNDQYIPMVPKHKANAGLHIQCSRTVAANFLVSYTGKRYFINDQANAFSRLNGSVTLDANVSYSYKDINLTLALNNVLDRQYAEYGVLNSTTGAKNYYPSPGRNFSVKIGLDF